MLLVMNMTDTWNPNRYERFRFERERPVHDLLALIAPTPGASAADLGCGTGRYTPLLHDRLDAAQTVGIDSSRQMLAGSEEFTRPGVSFRIGDIGDLAGAWDVLFANASLQWLPDHAELLPRLVERLRPGGQLAFQVPSNFDHPSHTVADDLGRAVGLEPLDRAIGARSPAAYAEILWSAGLRDLDVTLRIYGVDMPRTDDVVEWVSGTLLTRFEARLSADDYESFRAEYRGRLLDALGDPTGSSPYFYAFPRILCRGRRPG
jgi:trans-aconitate 2-methyltransferase